MEPLISASIGLFIVGKTFYLQIISSERERFYFVPINAADAGILARTERLQVDIAEELPDGMIIQPATGPIPSP
jgi:hypothetical protein